MRIGGYLPFSLSDYPGFTSAVVFTQGCNFRCPFCHNAALLGPLGEGQYSTDDILARLERRRGLLQGVVVSGGEPTLQTGLATFCGSVKNLGFRLKLDTNGSRPAVLRHLLDSKLVDYVAMDVKAPFDAYDSLAGVSVDIESIGESIQVLVDSGVEHHFRTTVVPSLLSPNDLDVIRRSIPENSRHVLQTFRPENALALAG